MGNEHCDGGWEMFMGCGWSASSYIGNRHGNGFWDESRGRAVRREVGRNNEQYVRGWKSPRKKSGFQVLIVFILVLS